MKKHSEVNSMPNDKKQKTKKIWMILVILLILSLSFCGFSVWQFNKAMQSVAGDFQSQLEAINKEDQLTSQPVEIETDTNTTEFYRALVSELEKYGDLSQTSQDGANLLTQIYVKTLKDCTVRSIEFEQDHMIINLQGVTVPLSKLDQDLVASALQSASLSYLSHHLIEAAGSILQGEDAIKEQLYSTFANQFLVSLKDKIMAMPVEPVYYELDVRIKDGKWIVESFQQQTPPSTETRAEKNKIDRLTSSDQNQ